MGSRGLLQAWLDRRITWNNESVRALLVSTYDLGRQPRGLAVPAVGAARRGRRRPLRRHVARAVRRRAWLDGVDLVGFYLPMHTATRLAGPLIDRVRRARPEATLAAYGLYAPLNRDWLRQQGVHHVLGPEAEQELAALAGGAERSATRAASRPRRGDASCRSPAGPVGASAADALRRPADARRHAARRRQHRRHARVQAPVPALPGRAGVSRPLRGHSARRRAGTTSARRSTPARSTSRLAIPISSTGPRTRAGWSSGWRRSIRGVTYDVTIKIEHLLAHAELLPVLAATGCLFVTSAVESVDDAVLEKLRKGHTRADFERAVALCREAGAGAGADVRAVHAVDDAGRLRRPARRRSRGWSWSRRWRRSSSPSGCW